MAQRTSSSGVIISRVMRGSGTCLPHNESDLTSGSTCHRREFLAQRWGIKALGIMAERPVSLAVVGGRQLHALDDDVAVVTVVYEIDRQ